MSKSYGQYCPLAITAELLCQRWTLLVISRLIDGCRRFSEIHRGLPQISPSLLSKRLSQLKEAGLVEVRKLGNGTGRQYLPTDATRELEPVIERLGMWGQRWARDMTKEDLDPAFLVWSMHLRMEARAMPPGRTVIEFEFSGAPRDGRRFWLVSCDGGVEMCLKDPELDVDLLVTSRLRTFVEAWRGFRDLRQEIAAGRIKLYGQEKLCRRFPSWLRLSMLAPYPRLRAGRERRLSRSAPPGQ